MKVSLNWLSDYVKHPLTLNELAHRLTMAGLEIEAIEHRGQGLNGVVVAQIQESQPHPNADKLSVTQVDVGDGKLRQVVCGAKNYKVGDKVPLATAGAKLPNGMEIKVSPLRGVESQGMLCSAKELGLAEESSGLLILAPETPLGIPIAKALDADDTVFEVNVTPNRADALSHLGIAREVAALTQTAWKAPVIKVTESNEPAAKHMQIRIEAPEKCLRYALRIVEGVTVAPSPRWLQARLEACGVRPINNIVDVTNYVLLEYGQPLHAFDLDRLSGGQMVVRPAQPGEKLVTLDGKERNLAPEDLLVCDAKRPHVLAGVMGGADSEVSPQTRRILLECAYFQPSTVRRSSKRHGLHSESSHRFERGVDIDAIPEALNRAAALIAELGKGQVLQGMVDAYPQKVERRQVTLRRERLNTVLGIDVPASEVSRFLQSLGFELVGETPHGWTLSIPSRRQDVAIEEDLIEEVARMRGYDAIPALLPQGSTELRPEKTRVTVERRARQALATAGFDEVVNYSFVSGQELASLGAPEGIALLNPLSVEQSVMRTSMFAGLLQNVSRNLRHQTPSGRLYEMGRVYLKDATGGSQGKPIAHEAHRIAGVLWGSRLERKWTSPEQPVDFFDAKGAITAILATLHVKNAQFGALEAMPYHPRAAARIELGGQILGMVGEIHPKVRKAFDLPEGIFLFELDFEALCEAAQLVPSFAGLSKFPSLLRDLAVVVPTELAHQTVQSLILEVGAPLVHSARLFDVYQGKPLPEGKKNLAYALEYKATERTLTDNEVQQAHDKIVEEVNRRLGGSLRGA